jgi:protein SCO1/2
MILALPRRVFFLVTALSLALLAGCAKRAAEPGASTPAGPKEYALCGEVVAFSQERGTVIAKHDEIPGYMPPMTMEFSFEPADQAKLVEGKRFRARLVDNGKGNLHLQAVEPIDEAKEQQVKAAAHQLRQDTAMRGKGAYREVGETVPQFSLYNQEGDVVSFERFRGRRVVLNFIYTRCPIATMCPASTMRMMALQQAAKEKGVTNFELVSLSLDPAYDTPTVLKDYAKARGIDTTHFTFLTGPESAVRDLLRQFGVIVEPGENYLKHTLATLLIDERGKIIHRVDGTAWLPAEFLSRLPVPSPAHSK